MLSLAGCGIFSNNDFREKFKPQTHSPIIMWILDKEEINIHRERVAKRQMKLSKRVEGFSLVGDTTCIIYVQPPNTALQRQVLLHEIMHCQDKEFTH
jgi:hypothetical protein